jgi:hypothetical protein
VLPELASKIILSLVNNPFFSAEFIILYAILSFIEPPILYPSSFAKRLILLKVDKFKIGVLPIKLKIVVTGFGISFIFFK